MTPLDSLNKFLHKEVMGECWHEWDWQPDYEKYGYKKYICLKCGYRDREVFHINYTTDEHYLKLVRKCIEEDWWDSFVEKYQDEWLHLPVPNYKLPSMTYYISKMLSDPSLGARAIATFRGWKE